MTSHNNPSNGGAALHLQLVPDLADAVASSAHRADTGVDSLAENGLDPERHIFSPIELSQLLGQKFPPTDQQAAVIGAPPQGATLVTAGAGAGKTETMAARVVWLVANGYVFPEQVLGLTFTKKAASELGVRIRTRLASLAQSKFMDQLNKDDPRRMTLKNISPAVSTYDSYAGTIVREYGLLIPIEPSSRVITQAERWMIAWDLVMNWDQPLETSRRVVDLVNDVQALSDEMDNHLVSFDDVESTTVLALQGLEELPKRGGKWSQDNQKFYDAQTMRLAILPLVKAFRARMEELHVMSFGQQMSKAAALVEKHAQIGVEQRRRFRVVLLDEYQDTGHAQRVMLRNLFGLGADAALSVTAVGDPMQSIYMFRGATASNLEKFRTDFPLVGGAKAHKLELTTSWRNPAGVLELANEVADWSMDTGRTVSPLRPRPGAGRGEISLAFYEREDQEITWMADELARHWADYQAGDKKKPFSAAVLVTRNKMALPIYEALRERGVPAEMTAGPGLLDLPEVADVYATLRAVVDPEDDSAVMRLLTGPRLNLGAADIAALSRRAQQLRRRAQVTQVSESETAADTADQLTEPHALAGDLPPALREALIEVIPDPNEQSVGLADALADFHDAEAQGMSSEGARRIEELAQELGQLRRHSLAKPLPDLIADIEKMIGVRTEVLTRWFQDQETSIGTSHLDKFADIVRDFSNLPNASPSALVDYLRAAHDEEGGLEPGEVQKKLNTVQILTVHKSKGLEWDIVAVPYATRNYFADASQTSSEASWTHVFSRIPTELRGDSEPDPETGRSLPIFEPPEDGQSSDHKKAVDEFKTELNKYGSKESDRVFYVAITRTERVLLVSGSAYSPDRKSAVDPSVVLTLLLNKAQASEVVHRENMGKKYSKEFFKKLEKGNISREDELLHPTPEENAHREERDKAWAAQLASTEIHVSPAAIQSTRWPRIFDTSGILHEAAQAVAQADADADSRKARRTEWDIETDALIEEFQQRSTPEVRVPLGTRLTATEAVALRRDEQEYAKRRRRPIPLEPQPYAKRGTAFHNWVEQRYERTSLLDEDQLPGASDATLNDPELERLKSAFLESEWADRQPYSVEGAYSVTLGGHVFEGRIDAVFHEGDDMTRGWLVVDWKTGKKPNGEDMRAAEMQLGVYRLAWAKVLSRQLGVDVQPEGVRAAFHYVRTNQTVEPRTLPSADQLLPAAEGMDT